MGFFSRRREDKLFTDMQRVGDFHDRLATMPLSDDQAQELREAVEHELSTEWKMPPFWAQVGFDLTNEDPDLEDQTKSFAFTDALVLGYVLRRVELDRPDGNPVPEDIRVRLAGARTTQDRATAAMETARS